MAVKDGASYRISVTPAIILAQLLGIASITLMLVWLLRFRGGISVNTGNIQRDFNGHPFFMLLGLIFLGGQAIMAYKTVPGTRKTRKFVHLLFHLLALGLGGLGLYAAFKFHKDVGLADMYTMHSWFGMGAIALYALQVLDTRGRLLTALGYGLWPSLVLLAEVVQTLILADFCYYYVKSVFGGQLVLRLPSGVVGVPNLNSQENGLGERYGKQIGKKMH